MILANFHMEKCLPPPFFVIIFRPAIHTIIFGIIFRCRIPSSHVVVFVIFVVHNLILLNIKCYQYCFLPNKRCHIIVPIKTAGKNHQGVMHHAINNINIIQTQQPNISVNFLIQHQLLYVGKVNAYVCKLFA